MRRRLTLYSLLLFISLGIALVATYSYGHIFQHDRYWKGTIHRVQNTEIELLGAMLRLPGISKALADATAETGALMDALRGKLVLRIMRDGRLMRSNRVPEFELAGEAQDLTPGTGPVTVSVQRYAPPTWNSQFIRWLSRPWRWLQISYDHITAPFIFFAVLSYLFLVSMAWRSRAHHLSHEVLTALRQLRSDE